MTFLSALASGFCLEFIPWFPSMMECDQNVDVQLTLSPPSCLWPECFMAAIENKLEPMGSRDQVQVSRLAQQGPYWLLVNFSFS